MNRGRIPTSVEPSYVVGLDLGQAQDYTALVVVEASDEAEPVCDVRHAERLPLGTRYPAVVAHACAVVAALRTPTLPGQPRPRVALVVDYTGVGRPVADMLTAARPDATLLLATITGGEAVTRGEDRSYHIPKRVLASTVAILLQAERLRIAAALPMASALTEELTGFRVKISANGHDSYGAGEDWRSAPHDDLVLALALACWWASLPKVVAGIF